MSGSDLEPELGQGSAGQLVEQFVRHGQRRAAVLADQVSVALSGQVVGGWAVPEVDVLDHAEPLELVEVAVDGGPVDLGVQRPHGRDELVGGTVAGSVEQTPEQQASRHGDPAALGPEEVENRAHGVVALCVLQLGWFVLLGMGCAVVAAIGAPVLGITVRMVRTRSP